MLSGGLRTKGITKQSQEKQPLITVVTVVYNGEKTLEQTIQSVINQTYKNVEYIMVDGSSIDGTLDIIKKYEDKIDYWMSEPDKGIYDAMNKGIDLAAGDYIALLNSDDWYEQDTCKIIASKINELEADVYYGMVRLIDRQNNKSMCICGHKIYFIKNTIIMIAHPTCFISRKIYSEFKYDTEYKSASDYDLIIKIYKSNARFCFIEKTMVNFRTGGMSESLISEIETLEIRRKYKFISLHKYYLRKILILITYLYKKIMG